MPSACLNLYIRTTASTPCAYLRFPLRLFQNDLISMIKFSQADRTQINSSSRNPPTTPSRPSPSRLVSRPGCSSHHGTSTSTSTTRTRNPEENCSRKSNTARRYWTYVLAKMRTKLLAQVWTGTSRGAISTGEYYKTRQGKSYILADRKISSGSIFRQARAPY